jgi:iron complex outermembrane receptor protein
LRELPHYFDDSEMLNARLAWISGDGHYEIALWGKNLLDKELIQGVRTITRSSFGTTFVGIEDPLTWGLEGRYTW